MAARRLLFDPEFRCTEVAGATGLWVEYDPAIWVRLPTLGQDRTTWVEQVQHAYAEDLGWTEGTPEHAKISAAANRIADTELCYTANFITFPPGPTDFSLAHLQLHDPEGMLLAFGEPEAFLSLADVKPSHPAKIQTFPQGWRYNLDTFLEDDGTRGVLVRGHKEVAGAAAPIHLVGLGLGRGREAKSGDMLGLFAHTRVSLVTGRRV